MTPFLGLAIDSTPVAEPFEQLGETPAHRLVLVPNRCLVNHPIVIGIQLMLGNPPTDT